MDEREKWLRRGWSSSIKTAMNYRARAVVGALTLAAPLIAVCADVVSIWGGARGTVVQKSDGTVWTWGANFGGKLGIGLASTNLGRVLVPAEVHGPGDVSFLNSLNAIMGGEVHNVALKSDGTVWAWGANIFGQLGNGSTNEAHTPVQVSGLSSVTALGGRGYHTLAIDAGGSVWGWGWNSAGELGNGTTNPTRVPVKVVGLTNPAVVSAGYKFSIALMPNGTVFQWGHGRVIGNSYTPVQTPGLSNIVDSILDRFVEAAGGRSAMEKIKSRTMKGDLDLMGSTSDWVLEAKAPNKQFSGFNNPTLGVVVDGFDGTVAWSKNQS